MANRVTAIMPMKEHSSRVPGKNIRPLCKKPMYRWVIEAMLRSEKIDKIMINTDSDTILQDVQGAFPRDRVFCYRRPDFLLGDFISMNPLIKYDMDQAGGEHFLQTHATNPLLTTATIDKAIERYFTSFDHYDSLFTVNKIQTRLYHGNGMPINHDPDNPAHIHSQNIEPIFEENSNIYLFSRKSFYENKERRYGLRPQMMEMDPLESLDVDYEYEFKNAEILMQMRLESESNQ